MKIQETDNADIFGNRGKFNITKYIGEESLKEFPWMVGFLGKRCILESNPELKGIVIGIEKNEVYWDDYLIVLCDDNEVRYELNVKILNDSEKGLIVTISSNDQEISNPERRGVENSQNHLETSIQEDEL